MLVLAMEFSRDGRAEIVDAERGVSQTRNGRSLKTEQRCPAVFAAPHGRPMVYDRGDARTTE